PRQVRPPASRAVPIAVRTALTPVSQAASATRPTGHFPLSAAAPIAAPRVARIGWRVACSKTTSVWRARRTRDEDGDGDARGTVPAPGPRRLRRRWWRRRGQRRRLDIAAAPSAQLELGRDDLGRRTLGVAGQR